MSLTLSRKPMGRNGDYSQQLKSKIFFEYDGGVVELSIIEINGNQVRIGIDAPKDVAIYRGEIYEKMEYGGEKSSLEGGGLEKTVDESSILGIQ